jgi:hypothetical protein
MLRSPVSHPTESSRPASELFVLLRNAHACGDADAFALVLRALGDRADSQAYEQCIQLLADQVCVHLGSLFSHNHVTISFSLHYHF